MSDAFVCDMCDNVVKYSGTPAGFVRIDGEEVIPPVSGTREYTHEYDICESCADDLEKFIEKHE